MWTHWAVLLRAGGSHIYLTRSDKRVTASLCRSRDNWREHHPEIIFAINNVLILYRLITASQTVSQSVHIALHPYCCQSVSQSVHIALHPYCCQSVSQSVHIALHPYYCQSDSQSVHLALELCHVCTVLDMPESNEMTEQIDWREKQPSQASCVAEDLKW